MIMIRYLPWVLIFSIPCIAVSSPSLAQMNDEDINTEPEHYHESALRRFEIVFITSIPFTSLHSYLTVRGMEMVRQRKVSPEFSRVHWSSIGGLTFLFAGFVAFWDYLHTRGDDIQNMNMPRRQTEPLAVMQDTGHRYQAMVREPTLRLLSIGF